MTWSEWESFFDSAFRQNARERSWWDPPAVAAELLRDCGRVMANGGLASRIHTGRSTAGFVVEQARTAPLEMAVEAASFLQRAADEGLYDRRRVSITVRCEPTGESSGAVTLRFRFA